MEPGDVEESATNPRSGEKEDAGKAAIEEDKLKSYVVNMKRKMDNILGLQRREASKLTDLKENVKIQRERIMSVFSKVQQFLENEKCRYLSDLEKRKTMNLKIIGENVLKFVAQQASVKSLITKMESKCQQVDVDLLKDVKSILKRYEDLDDLHPDPGYWSELLMEIKQKTENVKEQALVKVVEGEEDVEKKIIESLDCRWARQFAHFADRPTLDPITAYRRLVLSEDGRSVRLGEKKQLGAFDTAQRYKSAPCVLGREWLSSGRYYWEVEVGEKTAWDLGVCGDSVSRKRRITPSPEDGYWAVWLRDGEYKALTSSTTLLTPSEPPRVVGLFLDYEAGRLSLYNVTDRSLLFTFSGASFPPTLRPFFSPGPSDGGRNGDALTILSVTRWD